jgi:DNA-binding IclR family transcriptional regulator
MPKQKQLDKNYIAVMGKIFEVLNYLIDKSAKQEPVAFSAMVKALPFSRTTIHRILYSLEKLGYVEKAELAAHYRLAAKFFEFTGPAVHFKHLQSISRSIMNDLMARHVENVNLGVLQNGQVVHLDVIQSPNALRVAAFPGERNPLHCTALGKAILAFLPESEVNTLLDGHPLVKKTPRTITQKAHLREHLALVREHGIAIDLEENLSGVTCLAAPIFDHAGRVVAALSVSGPTSRMNSKLSALKIDLRAAALSATRMIAPLYETEQPSTRAKQPARRSSSNSRKTKRPAPTP